MTVHELIDALLELPADQHQLPVMVVCKDYWLVLAEQPTLTYCRPGGMWVTDPTAGADPVIKV